MPDGGFTKMPELPEEAHCAKCGYCLRGLAISRCPECGTQFDPYALLEPFPPFIPKTLNRRDFRRLVSPAWTEYAAAVVAVIWCAWVWGDLDAADDSTFVWAILPASCVLLLMVIDVLKLQYILRGRNIHRRTMRWSPRKRVVVAAVLVVILSSYVSPWPVDPRFWISKPALERLARQVLTTGQMPPDHWVGLYYARYISRIGNGMNFRLGEWNECRGLEYVIPGQQPARAVQYRHLGGRWYRWAL